MMRRAPNKPPSIRTILLHSLALFLMIVTTSLVCPVAFWLTGTTCDFRSVALATTMATVAFIPPLWIEVLMGPSVAGPIAVVLWRMAVLLPALLLTANQIEPARKCCQATLVACYLVSLPLESWLLIRQTRQ